jgi:hypothetical protein
VYFFDLYVHAYGLVAKVHNSCTTLFYLNAQNCSAISDFAQPTCWHLTSAPDAALPCCCCCRFRLGRQEDAHEYLRCVLDAMHEAYLKHIRPKPPPELAATTFVHRIFGGKLRSQVGRGCWVQLLLLVAMRAAVAADRFLVPVGANL